MEIQIETTTPLTLLESAVVQVATAVGGYKDKTSALQLWNDLIYSDDHDQAIDALDKFRRVVANAEGVHNIIVANLADEDHQNEEGDYATKEAAPTVETDASPFEGAQIDELVRRVFGLDPSKIVFHDGGLVPAGTSIPTILRPV